jgi:hypothetical protein
MHFFQFSPLLSTPSKAVKPFGLILGHTYAFVSVKLEFHILFGYSRANLVVRYNLYEFEVGVTSILSTGGCLLSPRLT